MILDSSMLHVRLGFVRLLPRAFWLLTLLLVVSSCAIMPFSNVVSGMLVAGYYDLGDGVGVIGGDLSERDRVEYEIVNVGGMGLPVKGWSGGGVVFGRS